MATSAGELFHACKQAELHGVDSAEENVKLCLWIPVQIGALNFNKSLIENSNCSYYNPLLSKMLKKDLAQSLVVYKGE